MDKRNWTYKLTVLESYLDQSYDWSESADRAMTTDMAQTGIHSGFTAAQDPAGPNLKIQISGPGYAHDKVGRRLYESDTTVLVDCEYDEYGIATAVTLASGLERWISVFARFSTQYAEPIVDGNGLTVYSKEYEDVEFFVRQAVETASPSSTYVALQSEAILVCDILLTDGMTQILNADINLDRREDWYRELATTLTSLGDQSFGTPYAAINQLVQWVDILQSGSGVSFTGVATWHDATTIAATTVSTAIEEIVTVLAVDTTTPGSDKIGSDEYVAGATFTLARGSVWDQLKEIADAIEVSVQSNADETITGQWDFTDFITIDCSGVAATNATSITCTAKGTGVGGDFTGGSSSGAGVIAQGGGSTNGIGIYALGAGAAIITASEAVGAGLYGRGALTGDRAGVVGSGGATNGYGVIGLGSGTGYGGYFTGGDTNGIGVLGLGKGTGEGGNFTGGDGTGTDDGGYGVITVGGIGSGSGDGGRGIFSKGGDGGSTGDGGVGVYGVGGDTTAGNYGYGVIGKGGSSASEVGVGVLALGANSIWSGTPAGQGLVAVGDSLSDANSSDGIDSTGGTSYGSGAGGVGGSGADLQGGSSVGSGNDGGYGLKAHGGTAASGEYGGVGVYCSGSTNRTGLQIAPRAQPISGKIGDIWIDTAGKVYSCTTASKTAASWTKVGLQT